VIRVIRHLATHTDDVWVVDSTPVEYGRSKETAKRSDLAGFAGYGYWASHPRYFWGLRCTWCARWPASRSGTPG